MWQTETEYVVRRTVAAGNDVTRLGGNGHGARTEVKAVQSNCRLFLSRYGVVRFVFTVDKQESYDHLANLEVATIVTHVNLINHKYMIVLTLERSSISSVIVSGWLYVLQPLTVLGIEKCEPKRRFYIIHGLWPTGSICSVIARLD